MSEHELDDIFGAIDDLLLAGKYAECSRLLDDIVVETQSIEKLLTILTATYPSHDRLQTRCEFLARVRGELTRRGADWQALMHGLDVLSAT